MIARAVADSEYLGTAGDHERRQTKYSPHEDSMAMHPMCSPRVHLAVVV